MPVREAPEQAEVRVGRDDLHAHRGQTGQRLIAYAAQHVDLTEHLVGVREGDERERLRLGREVVRQPHDPQRVDDRRIRRQVAQTAAREGEGLAHRPAHDEVAVLGKERQRRRRGIASELLVRLVDDHDRVGAGQYVADHAQRRRRTRRVVGRRDDDHGRVVLGDRIQDQGCIEGVVGLPRNGQVGRVRVPGVLRIHGVGRRERQHRASGTSERAQDVRHHLVGAVGRPDHLGRDTVAEVVGQCLPQRPGLPVGIAVHIGRRGDDSVRHLLPDVR